jgi:iron-sulfur cluster assembly accessory protein
MTMTNLVTLGDLTARPAPPPTITVTDAAAARAKVLLQTKGMPGGALRVFVVGGGCSGYQYGMALAEGPEEGDLVITHNDVRIVVDEDSIRHLAGAEIDFVDDIMKSGFTIFNPNAVKSCACGSSFQTADGSGQARACH